MPRVKTYLKNGQIIETVCDTAATGHVEGILTNANWEGITEGERVLYVNLPEVIAITEVIEPQVKA